MNLNVFYLKNETGELLFRTLQSELNIATLKEYKISIFDYIFIEIPDKESNSLRILNSPLIIHNCISKDYIFSILEINNIAYVDNSENSIIRSYKVLICDLACISVKVSYYGKAKEKAHYVKESENKKVVEIARRTAYVLGLDIALINIVLTSKRRYKVKSVDMSPILRKKDINEVISVVKEIYFIDRLSKTVKLGADPEFMLFNKRNDKMLSASQFFPRDGIVGCDAIRIPNRQQRPVAEIRPKPDTSPIELITNITHALKNAYQMAPYRNVKWIAGSQPARGYSIGGHIHFSNLKLNFDILRALDNYVGIPVFLIENPATAASRRKKYGYLGDYRIKDYGGFEYRTPGSWLVSPEIAAAVLCLAKIVASRYIELPQKYLNSVEAQKAFYEGNQNFFRSIFNKLWDDIEKTDIYDEYKEKLQIIPYMVKNNLCWDEKTDFSEQWKLKTITGKKSSKKKLSNKTSQKVDNTPSINDRNTSDPSRNRRNRIRESRITYSNIDRHIFSRADLYSNESRGNYNHLYGQIISPGSN